MVKLFIGNLPREATEQEIRSLFEQYGKVLECDIIKNYGFVHIEDKTAAEDAIRNLHHHKLHGVCINVEASKNKSKASTKLHVGNISPTCTNLELRAKFEEYGPVIECDIVKDYAFVHMERAEDAVEAIRGLDNTEFQGRRATIHATAAREGGPPGRPHRRHEAPDAPTRPFRTTPPRRPTATDGPTRGAAGVLSAQRRPAAAPAALRRHPPP
ncbi:RNA-binding protein 4B isoform X5 [Gallus gallus]|uniref:RNA-binding protein 4B isoform X5 n=1 Tax=Gallus gallus TaxID=9031 RepID=UPI000739E026|nr:RNA-binding protein 4B isoform X5 [Gallus gallus]